MSSAAVPLPKLKLPSLKLVMDQRYHNLNRTRPLASASTLRFEPVLPTLLALPKPEVPSTILNCTPTLPATWNTAAPSTSYPT
ncbi:hypothetical protein G6F54_014361 [Rhizopus delemar]|nr:hypothetical protein G6F54_014361 [Rhizopus delemar]